MQSSDYSLSIPTDQRQRLARAWLWLGLFALIVPGVFALLLISARLPGLQPFLGWAKLPFLTALVLHVDLSILVWFIAFGAVLWSLNCAARWLPFGWVGFGAAATGAGLIALAPLTGDANPLSNNYIPVLQQPVFLTGLALFGVGTLFFMLRTLVTSPSLGDNEAGASATRFGLVAAALTVFIALIAFAWSFFSIAAMTEGEQYYETLFWGGGHLLQFAYTLLMLVAWLWLASASGVALAVAPRTIKWILALGFLPVLAAPVAYYLYGVESGEHRAFFARHMQYTGGLAAVPITLLLLHGWWRSASADAGQRALRAALTVSVLLFAAGGVIGYLITGVNVTTPAHYHGSIIGVTVAFMGLTYWLLPRLGYGDPNRRWASIQPWLLGSGQLLHILGLAWLGGYNVQRKVADGLQVVDTMERIGRIVMNFGGLLAILGGLVFLVVVFVAMRRR